MDITRDGKLSKTEVKAGFYKVSGTLLSDKEIDDMFSRVDCDGTGEIEYSEFVIASMSETDLLSTNRLRKAFQLFDKDKGGSITTDELREIFSFFQTAGSDMDDAVSFCLFVLPLSYNRSASSRVPLIHKTMQVR